VREVRAIRRRGERLKQIQDLPSETRGAQQQLALPVPTWGDRRLELGESPDQDLPVGTVTSLR
jgi:hypothetical protein